MIGSLKNHIDLAMIHDYPSIAEYVAQEAEDHEFKLLYWFTEVGYNSRVNSILSKQYSSSLLATEFNGFSLLDVAMANENEELIDLYRGLGIKSNDHYYPVPSIVQQFLFVDIEARGNKVIKLFYSPIDTISTISKKFSSKYPKYYQKNNIPW